MGYFLAYPNIPRSVIYNFKLYDVAIDIIETYFVFIFTLITAGLLWKYKITRIISIFISLLLAINFVISLVTRITYKSDLNNGITLSILNSNIEEGLSMALDFIPLIIIGIVFFIILLATTHNLSSRINFTLPNISIYIVSLILILLYNNYGYNTAFKEKNIFEFREENRKYFSNIYPIYHLNYFIVSYQFISDLKLIHSQQINYTNLKITDRGVTNYVLVIGESARRDNLSLYGYSRQTTPNEDGERKNLLLYTNAVSPAPLTLISIPLMLSKAMPSEYSYASPKYADNIINTAKHAGFDTYWITTQKFPGQDISLLSIFENFAHHIERIDGVYDEKILPYLDNVLKNPEKKLIILHINGSHPTYCDKYPQSEEYFKGGKGNRDCYDNSIRYTDKILGKVFKKLNNSSSILVYLSDHGKTKINNYYYTHADTQDNARVPFYIWYSPKVDSKLRKTGQINELTQTTILYDLMNHLMGITTDKKIQDSTLYHKNLKFVKSDLSIINYMDLPENYINNNILPN